MCKKSVKSGVKYNIATGNVSRRDGVPSQGITTAKLCNTRYDVVNLLNNSKAPFAVTDESRYVLPDCYAASTSCLMTDTYNEEKGKTIAKQKCLLKYNADKLEKIDLALADLEVIRKRLLTQKEIITGRMTRDKAALAEEVGG